MNDPKAAEQARIRMTEAFQPLIAKLERELHQAASVARCAYDPRKVDQYRKHDERHKN